MVKEVEEVEEVGEVLVIKFDDMKVIKTDIEGVVIIEPRVFEDARGYFFERDRKSTRLNSSHS